MELQPEAETAKPLKKTISKRQKARLSQIVERIFSMDDSFSRLIASETSAEQTKSESHRADAACNNPCQSNANIYSTQPDDNAHPTSSIDSTKPTHSVDGMISSSCSSFASVKSRPSKIPKMLSVSRKERYAKIISTKEQPPILDKEAARNPTEMKTDRVNTCRKSLKDSVSTNEGKKNVTFSSKSSKSTVESSHNSLRMKSLSEMDKLASEPLLVGRKGVTKKSVGAPSGFLGVTPSSRLATKNSSLLPMRAFGCFEQLSEKCISEDASSALSSRPMVSYVDASVQTDFDGCVDASTEANLCNCPRLIGFNCCTNTGNLAQQNASRSDRSCENLNSANDLFASGNHVSEIRDGKCIVPTSSDAIYSNAKAKNIEKDDAVSGAKTNKSIVYSAEQSSSEDLVSQMSSRIELSDCSEYLPDKLTTTSNTSTVGDAVISAGPEKQGEGLSKPEDRSLDNTVSTNTTYKSFIHGEKTVCESFDVNDSREDHVSPKHLEFSLQVSFSSDELLGGENPMSEIHATTASGDVLNPCNDSNESPQSNSPDNTIIFVVRDSETSDDSICVDDVRNCLDRAAGVQCIKTKVKEWEDDSAETHVNGSLDLRTAADELKDSLIDCCKTDLRSISLQVSLSSSDDISDESDDRLESVSLQRLDELLEQGRNKRSLNRNVSVLSDSKESSIHVSNYSDDVFVPESPHLSAAPISPSSAAEDGEEIEQARSKKQVNISNETPLDHSLSLSQHNISLQGSLPSNGSNDTPTTDDGKLANDHDHDLNMSSKEQPSLRQKPSKFQKVRNSNCLFETSDEEQSADSEDLFDRLDLHHSPGVPSRVLCSTFLGRTSWESRQGLHNNWTESPIETEISVRDRHKSKFMRRVSLFMRNKKESTSDSYQSANGSVLVVPDTSDSDEEGATCYKTAYMDRDEFVPDSSESRDDDTRIDEEETCKTQVVSISDSLSSDDGFENFLERVKTVEKVKKPSPPSLDDFVVDDSETEEEEEEEDGEAEDGFLDDVTSDSHVDGDDARVFYYQVDNEMEKNEMEKNEMEKENVDELSNRLGRVLHLSLSSDDDFETPVTSKKPGKVTLPSKDEDAKTSTTVTDGEGAGIFRHPVPVVPKRRILSCLTPKVSSTSVLADSKRQAPYTTGHAPQRHSFLKSLSADVTEFMRDTKAARYVRSFKSLRDDLTAELFTLFNEAVFDSKIPSDLIVIWNDRLRRTAGFCRTRLIRDDPPKRLAQIELSVKVCDSPDRLRDTLIHEMCHAIVWLEYGSREVHGPAWKYWARKANRSLPDLPLITRCHSYDINTKFIYKCKKCGYEIGRHSKSLDTEKKICGHCRGQFELLVRSRSGSRLNSVPSTPRTPNQFALFVKDNYGDIKRTQPGSTHKEVMAMIGARYSARKTAKENDGRVTLVG